MASKSYYESLLSNPNVQAALRTIRSAEGSTYNTLYGGGTFSSYAWHPLKQRAIVTASGTTTSAAGAYQFERGTWDSVARKLGLNDFSPHNQDIAALALIDQRGALNDVVNGNVSSFVDKTKPEWQSFTVKPFSTLLDYWNGVTGSTVTNSNSNAFQNIGYTLNDSQNSILKEGLPPNWKGPIVVVVAMVVLIAVLENAGYI